MARLSDSEGVGLTGSKAPPLRPCGDTGKGCNVGACTGLCGQTDRNLAPPLISYVTLSTDIPESCSQEAGEETVPPRPTVGIPFPRSPSGSRLCKGDTWEIVLRDNSLFQ